MNDREFKADIWSKTAAEWTAENPYLAKNDLGVESDTGKTKVGVGQRWSNTSYLPSAAGISEPPNDGNTYGRQSGQWVDLEQATSLQFRQGTDAERLAMSPVPLSGEPIYATDTKRLFIGDGTAVGGRSVLMGDSSSYIVCQPGDDIQAKYAAAKLLTPGGSVLSATNRATLLVMPGDYPLNTSAGTIGSTSVGLLIDTDFVDVVGVGHARWRNSFRTSGSETTIAVTANDVVVAGWGGSTLAAGAGGTNRLVVNCVGTNVYTCTLLPHTDGIPNVISGSVIGCVGQIAGLSAVPGRNVFTGEVVDCKTTGILFRNVIFQGSIRGGVFSTSSASSSFAAFQGRVERASFTTIATASLWSRSANGTSSPAAFTGACTISQASPAVVTKSSHGLQSGWRIRFSTTGTLPSGLDTSTTYYVRVIDTNSFSVATSVAGTLINTTTAGSGDHSIVIPPGVEGGRYSYCTTADGEFTTP